MQTTAITAVVLTHNEEKNLPACLQSLAGFCPVFVLDSGSTDQTLAIAKQFGAKTYHHDFTNHSEHWTWALTNLPFESEWLLALDADYLVSDKLKEKIVEDIESLNKNVNGIYVRYRYHFGGSAIRFGGTRQERLQIVRLQYCTLDSSDLVDNRFVVDGITEHWDATINESNYYDQDISIWMNKQDGYAIRLAVEEELRREGLIQWQGKPAFFGSPDQRVTWLRQKWLKFPLFIRPIFYFIFRYIFALGFLDGKGGFLYHFLQGFVLRIMIDWKIGQLRKLKITGDKLLEFKQKMLEIKTGSVEKVFQVTELKHERENGKS